MTTLLYDGLGRSRRGKSGALAFGALLCALYSSSAVAATIIYVQGNSATPQTAPTSVPVTFTAAQAAGDLNVVVVGWNNSSATVSTVADSKGNTYTRAAGPTVISGVLSQSIYYAKNIAAATAGANIVTVTFSAAAAYPDIRILEYSGADPSNPVDVTAASSGNSTTSSSGSATTTNATDLIFGANIVTSVTSGPGSGFTKRILTSPDGDIAEDEMVTTTGSYSATAPLSSGQWIMQMVAFRTPSGGGTAPTVSSVSPNSGPAAGATSVTITGTNFATGATVTFGSAAATNVVVTNSTTITATTPAGSAGAVTVTVTVSGQSGSLGSGFTYLAPPTMTSISPNTGSTAGGTAVTITGTNFAAGATVRFGATAATSVVVTNSTTITATTPAGSAGAVTVTVTVSGQSGSLTNGFTYAAIPGVTSVSPTSGPTTGGTAVTITGSNFSAGATVTFGSAAATNVVVVNATTITATTPAGSAGAVTVKVTVSGQSGSLASGFTYVAIPTVTSVSPSTGSTAGGTAVTITGTNFAAGATVTFGAAPATNVVVTNATTITATTPAGSAGAVTVTVTASGQNGGLTNGFTYVVIPTVTGVSPTSGPTAGGTAVTITGTNYSTGATVTFGSSAATNVVVVNATTITATTPAGNAGAVTVKVTVGGQSGSLANAFTYLAPPTVTSVSPNTGSTAGGTAVTITGTNFASGAAVTFGSTPATNVVVANSTTITATAPAGSAGAVTVTVMVSGQSGSLSSGFTYVVIPTVTSVSPNSGPTSGGTGVTITGTNFAAGAAVTFGGVAATNIVVVSGTSITAMTPAGTAGGTTVTVNVGGQSGNLPNGFTYLAPPTVTGVSPNTGSTAGGTPVTITGTNFSSGATVTFGSTPATNVVVANSTTITAVTPAGSPGAVTATVSVGGQSGNLANAFTYTVITTIIYVQGNSATPQTAPTSVPVTFTAAQAAGDLNVVVVGWNNSSATVSTVADSKGNTYTRAAGPTVISGVLSQSIYYAKNIAAATAGANIVTVTFSAAAAYPDIRILEYSGADPSNPVDVTAASSGNSTTSSSGSATTTNATDLIFGANIVTSGTSGPGIGFTQRILTSQDGDIAEDEMVTATGSYSAAAPLSSGQWIMQMVAFRTPSGGGTTPTVSGVSPNSGPTAGGTSVTITGTNFATGATVMFGAAAATNVVVTNSTTITATTPAGTAGAVTVTVTVSGQSGSLASGFTYLAPPTVTGVSPTTGSTAGGTAVTITGTNFAAGAIVKFGATAATSVVVTNSTTITATTPAGSAGAVTVTVTVGGQSGSLTNGFTYAAIPGVSSVSPTSGPTTGGTAVTITGSNFSAGATVAFGAAAATNVVVVNATTITATTPAGTAGAVTVKVTVGGQSGSLANAFTYVAIPTVTSVSPSTGSTAGGTAVTITGANFAAGATVTFGAAPATNVVVTNATTITATTPAGSAGAVTVTVTASGQNGGLTNGFTYVVIPTVTGVSPTSGPTAGGTAVTITGTNYSTGATVTFGSSAATNVVVVNATTITATTPAGNAGAVTVKVTVGGQSGSLANAFTYLAPPTVTSVSPNTGSTAGGTAVTITGTNFASGATVTFGGAPATNVVVANATTITATTPAGSAGAVTVTVTVSGQTGSLPNGFTYATVGTPTAPTNVSAVDGGPAPVVVAGQGYYNSSFLSSHAMAAFNSTGGDVIVMAVSSHSGVTITPSDSFNNTWIPISGPTNTISGNGYDLRTQLWYVRSPIVGPGHTVTLNLSFAQPLVASIIVAKGSNIASPMDAVSLIGNDNGTHTTNVVSPSITTTSANDLLIGFAKTDGNETFTAGTGFTLQSSATVANLTAETGTATTPNTYAASLTLSSGLAWESAVTAVANNPNQTTLSWTASTEIGGTISKYLVERCQGASCASFAQIGTSTSTTFNDTGLSLATSYSYRARAEDTGSNLGPYSSVVTVVTPALTSATPSAPGNITAGGPVVITGQSVDDGTSVTSHTSAPFDSTGGDVIVLAASSIATVSLTPSDSFGNTWTSVAGPTSTTQGSVLRTQFWYAQSPVVGPGHTVTVTLSAAEPLTMSVVVAKGSNVSSPFDAASLLGSDNGTQSATIVSPSVTTTGINDLLVGFAQDSGGGNFLAGSGTTEIGAASSSFLDAQSAPAVTPGTYSVTFNATSNSTWLAGVVAIANNPSQVTLSWIPSADIGGNETAGTISDYLIERCQGAGCASFTQIGTAPAATFTDTGLAASSIYNYRVRAQDTAQVLGPYSSVVTVSTAGALPTAPGNLSAAADRQGPIDLAWTASSSPLGVADYIVQRCQGSTCTNFVQIGTATGTIYTDSAVSPSTTYSYRVQAADSAGNAGPFSNIATASTVGNQPPTAPGNLTATPAGTSQINLTWTASMSSLGLANYVVERCAGVGCSNFAQLATPTGTSYSDTGLLSGASYSYEVEAIDIEGNVSPFSNVATAVTGSSTGSIAYVQGNYATPQASLTTVQITFNAAQAAADLNMVVIGWNDSAATVSSVTDTKGNTYTRAVGPTTAGGVLSQSIYYAKNIAAAAASANTVTVTFATAAAFPDIRILEYAGADATNPVDVTAAGTGNSASSSSGAATTTNATDLIFGANMVTSLTTGPGSGFTERLLTSPDGDIAEDHMVTSTGSYSATAPLSSGQWIMQMVALRTPSGVPTPAVNLTSTSLSFGNEQTGITTSPQPVTMTNVGTGQLTINSIAISGGNASDFGQTNTCGATLAPNGTCTISVTFTPSNTGSRSSAVLITDNASGSPQSISLSGTGTGFTVAPGVTVLTFTGTQQFSASSGSATWSVDGVAGGSATVGTITTGGLYIPPATAGTHTVSATNSLSQTASATVYITNYAGTYTYHNDNLRTGQNLNEAVLNASNVNQNQFGKLFSYPLDGISFASPLYVSNVSIPGQGYHNVVYVATENDSVYAFDADGLSSSPLWQASFLKSGVTAVPCADTGECGDIPTQIGITSTPVIDPTPTGPNGTGTIYVVAATKEGSAWVQRLHALDITTGAEKFGGPVALQATSTGTGQGASGGHVAFDPLRENQRPGLLLNGGVVYLAFGSHGDNNPWHGWILGYNAATLQQTFAINLTPNASGGGIWQSGGGLGADASGNVYFSTSNGAFDVNSGGTDYGDTIVKLTASGAVSDYFTPHDQANMNTNNLDLGSAGPVLLVDQATGPNPHLLISAGKGGTIYVVNRDNMGHYNASNDNQIVQALINALPNGNEEAGNFSQPVFFNSQVYFGAINDSIRAFQLTNGQLSPTPKSLTGTVYAVRGASFAVSANSSTGPGILWALQNNGASADSDTGAPGVLFAYDANNLATELYDSTQAGSRDTMDFATKFVIPLVANGKVFIAGQSQLTVYGLLP